MRDAREAAWKAREAAEAKRPKSKRDDETAIGTLNNEPSTRDVSSAAKKQGGPRSGVQTTSKPAGKSSGTTISPSESSIGTETEGMCRYCSKRVKIEKRVLMRHKADGEECIGSGARPSK